MSVAVTASLRPLQGLCRQSRSVGALTVRVTSPKANLSIRALVTLPLHRRGYQSQSGSADRESKGTKATKPDMSFRKFIGHALGASLRNLAVSVSPRGVRSAYKDAPVLTSMNIILLLLLAAISAIAIRSYVFTFYNSEFSRYPEPVANTLRRAIYYTNYKPNAELAQKYYKKAMEQVKEVGLDPFSDEVLGIRIQVSLWQQKINNYKGSIAVLESVLQDCSKWVAAFEKSAKQGKVDATGRLVSPATESQSITKEEAVAAAKGSVAIQTSDAEAAKDGPDVQSETLWRKRQRLLAKAVGTAVKLGEVYADEHVLDPDKSQKYLIWAVQTSLREFQRRKQEGTRPGEQAWLSPTELGGMMESLGRDYEQRSQFRLAVPLFFQALRVCERPCHRAVIMNNLAACFAQLQTPGALDSPPAIPLASDRPALPRTRQESLEAAFNWAKNAYKHGMEVKGDERTAECDEACAVALCNWGDVAALLGRTETAQKRYRQCIEMSRKLDFAEGITKAQEGLAKLTSTPEAKV